MPDLIRANITVSYQAIKNSFMFDPYTLNGFDFENLNLDFGIPVVKQEKVKMGNAEGYNCSSCNEFYPMVELNQPETAKEPSRFCCYGCRKGLNTIFGV